MNVTMGSYLFLFILIAVYAIATISPLKKGMVKLGNLTIYISIGMIPYFFFLGSSALFMEAIVLLTGQSVFSLGNNLQPLTVDEGIITWFLTMPGSYILWWISWTPFIGAFLAKISEGRTFKQYILGTIFLPLSFMILWFGIFGSYSYFEAFFGGTGGPNGTMNIEYYLTLISDLTGSNPTHRIEGNEIYGAFFELLETLPLAAIVILLLILFVARTATSASVTVAVIVDEREENAEPKKYSILLWALVMGGIAFTLIMADSLNSLRYTATLMGISYAFVLILQVFHILKISWNWR